ncbi:MAG: DUF3105 domain-containing protein [Acidimicrobiales bacterium]
MISELPDDGNDHVRCPTYEHRPPASGDHFDAAELRLLHRTGAGPNGGSRARARRGVDRLPTDLPADELAAIEARVGAEEHVLAAPYPGLQNAIVLTAWTRQLAVDRVADLCSTSSSPPTWPAGRPRHPSPGPRVQEAVGTAAAGAGRPSGRCAESMGNG